MKVRIVKIKELEDAEHPNNIEEGTEKVGRMLIKPVIGQCFYITYYPDHTRGLETSKVTEIIDTNTFKTMNSIYRITLL